MAFFRRISRLPSRLKITYSLIALVIILGIGTFIWAVISGKIKPLAAPIEATLTLPANSPVNIGESFSMYINLYNTSSAGITTVNLKYLHYDSSKVEITEVTPDSTDVWTVISNSIDPVNGIIDFSVGSEGYSVNGFTGTSSRLAIVHLRALSSGEARFWFDYTPNIGDTDVIANLDAEGVITPTDILVAPPEIYITVSDIIAPPGEDETTPGPTPIITTTACKKGCSPTPVVPPGSEATPVAEPTPTEEVGTEPSSEQVAVVTPEPSPLESVLIGPEATLTPFEISPEPSPSTTKLAGFSISKTVAIILYIVVPVLIVAIVFFIWWWRHRKATLSEDKSASDDDETDIDDEI